MLDRIKIGVKLPMATVLVGAIALILAEQISSRNTVATVTYAGQERLRAVAESRAAEILRELQSIRADLRAKYRNPVILDAARAFVGAWEDQGPGAPGELRRLYIDENPNPTDRRFDLVAAGDRSDYSVVHSRYHPFFAAHVKGQGYADLFLISPTGNVVYSTAKQEPFGRNLNAHGLRGLPLSSAFRRVIRGTGFSEDIMTDFTRSPAYPKADTLIFAVPVRGPNGSIDAVLAIRVSAQRFGAILQRPSGLGLTGEGFLLGRDRHLITGLRGASSPVIESGDKDAPPVAAVFMNRTGVMAHALSGGQGVMTAFVPLRYMGHHFGVLVQQSKAEILAPARVQRSQLLEEGLVVLALVTLIGLLLARSMSVPLGRVGDAMGRVANRDYDSDIPDRRRGDEIGMIARRLDSFRATLIEADAVSRENAFKRAAFEAASAALMLVDRDLTIIHVNAALTELMERHRTGFDRLARSFRPDSLTGRSLHVLFPGAERARADLVGGRHAVENLRLGEACLTVDLGPVEDGKGRSLGYVVEWRDVSAEFMDRAVLDAVGRALPIAEFSPDGRLINANRRFAFWFGQSGADLVGLDWSRLVQRFGSNSSGNPLPDWDSMVARAQIDGGAPTFTSHDGSARAEISLFPVHDEDGRLNRFVLVGLGRLATAFRYLRSLPDPEIGAEEHRA